MRQTTRDKGRSGKIVQTGRSARWSVSAITEKAEERNPRPPFTTSTLQQTASTRLGFAPSRTMRTAQKLYEAGHITYMRTDSVNLGRRRSQRWRALSKKNLGKNISRCARTQRQARMLKKRTRPSARLIPRAPARALRRMRYNSTSSSAPARSPRKWLLRESCARM